jgi:hypothetical protein
MISKVRGSHRAKSTCRAQIRLNALVRALFERPLGIWMISASRIFPKIRYCVPTICSNTPRNDRSAGVKRRSIRSYPKRPRLLAVNNRTVAGASGPFRHSFVIRHSSFVISSRDHLVSGRGSILSKLAGEDARLPHRLKACAPACPLILLDNRCKGVASSHGWRDIKGL